MCGEEDEEKIALEKADVVNREMRCRLKYAVTHTAANEAPTNQRASERKNGRNKKGWKRTNI